MAARDLASGRIFQFSAPAAIIGKLQVGQGIYANFGAKQVSVDGIAPCCGMASGPLENSAAKPANPCCAVVSVDTAKGVATARDQATGRTFDFFVADAALLKSLPGRSVFANFRTNQVSVDGLEPCCGIAVTATSSALLPPAGPCCGITAIDARTGIVAARDLASGRVFQFSASAAVLRTIRVGQSIYADYTKKSVSLVPGTPCCTIR